MEQYRPWTLKLPLRPPAYGKFTSRPRRLVLWPMSDRDRGQPTGSVATKNRKTDSPTLVRSRLSVDSGVLCVHTCRRSSFSLGQCRRTALGFNWMQRYSWGNYPYHQPRWVDVPLVLSMRFQCNKKSIIYKFSVNIIPNIMARCRSSRSSTKMRRWCARPVCKSNYMIRPCMISTSSCPLSSENGPLVRHMISPSRVTSSTCTSCSSGIPNCWRKAALSR